LGKEAIPIRTVWELGGRKNRAGFYKKNEKGKGVGKSLTKRTPYLCQENRNDLLSDKGDGVRENPWQKSKGGELQGVTDSGLELGSKTWGRLRRRSLKFYRERATEFAYRPGEWQARQGKKQKKSGAGRGPGGSFFPVKGAKSKGIPQKI